MTNLLPVFLRIGAAAAIGVLFLLIQAGVFDGLAGSLGGTQIEDENIGYLQDARDASVDDLIVLSEVLAVLEIIDSASIGFDFFVSADVQVGQGLASLTNGVERALEIAALSAAASEGLIALSLIAQFVTAYLLDAALIALAAYLFVSAISRLHAFTRLARVVAEVFAVLFLVAYLIIPYSIHLSGWVATNAVSALHQESRDKLTALHGDVTGKSVQSDEFDGWSKDDQVKSGFERITSNLTHKIDGMGLYAIRHLTSAVLLGIVFPFGLLLVFYAGARRLIRYTAMALESDWSDVSKDQTGTGEASA